MSIHANNTVSVTQASLPWVRNDHITVANWISECRFGVFIPFTHPRLSMGSFSGVRQTLWLCVGRPFVSSKFKQGGFFVRSVGCLFHWLTDWLNQETLRYFETKPVIWTPKMIMNVQQEFTYNTSFAVNACDIIYSTDVLLMTKNNS